VIETIIIGVLSVLLIVSLYGLAFLKKQQIDLALHLAQSKIDVGILQQQVIQMNEDKKLLESEEFMQFLTSSREYAFDYIQAVQDAISDYNAVVEPLIKYHQTYGMAFGMDSVPYQQMESISKAHEAFMEIMPSEPQTKNG
jgi:tRNA splicing endonuclease